MNLKKILWGEPEPDRTDPKNLQKYQQQKQAGMDTARILHLDSMAARLQDFAYHHSRLFLGIVFAFVLMSVGTHVYRLTQALQHRRHATTAVEQQERLLPQDRVRHIHHPQIPLNSQRNVAED